MLDLERLYDGAAEDLASVAPIRQGDPAAAYNGRVLSIRAVDLQALAVFYDCTPTELIKRLADHQVLVADPRAFFAS